METVQVTNVNVTDLLASFRQIVREEYVGMAPVVKKNKLFTRKQTAEQLSITLPTLNEYVKRGYIKASRIGSRVLFAEEDILAALKEIPSLKRR